MLAYKSFTTEYKDQTVAYVYVSVDGLSTQSYVQSDPKHAPMFELAIPPAKMAPEKSKMVLKSSSGNSLSDEH